MNKYRVRILVTGGTIDDLDYEREEDAPKNHQSLIPHLLNQSRISVDYEVEVLLQKDSRVITAEDRQLILEHCRSSEGG